MVGFAFITGFYWLLLALGNEIEFSVIIMNGWDGMGWDGTHPTYNTHRCVLILISFSEISRANLILIDLILKMMNKGRSI